MTRGGYYSVDSLGGIYVLVVDDDANARAMLTSVLQYCGGLVTAVASESAALESMRQVKPDVLVVALTRFDGEGYALVQSVRALKPEDGGVVPIIVVSEHPPPEQTGRGFDAHLPRPFDSWSLCRLVSQLVITGS
jgi:CheY-like chemotaxis protein